MPTLRTALVTATLLVPAAGIALAQPAPPPPAWGQQTSDVTGTVRNFLLTPRGDLEGVILTAGTEVHVPPHLSQQLAAAVRVGDPIDARGWRSATANMIEADALTDQRSGQSIVDQGPPPRGTMPPPLPPGYPAPGAQQGTVQGRVQQAIYGPAGDINGALLEDGTEIKLPPPAAWQMSSLLRPGATVVAQGWVLATPYGRVADVQAVGPTANQLTPVGVGGQACRLRRRRSAMHRPRRLVALPPLVLWVHRPLRRHPLVKGAEWHAMTVFGAKRRTRCLLQV